MGRPNFFAVALSAGILALVVAPVQASRVISYSVSVDGKEVLIGHGGDDGFPGPFTVWRSLKDSPLRPAQGHLVPFLPDSPLEVVLKGKIQVIVRYGATVDTSELKLTRKNVTSDEWFIDPAWIEANGPKGDPVDEERRLTARRDHEFERHVYWALSVLAAGFAALSWLTGLAALVLFLMGGPGRLRALAVATLIFAALAMIWFVIQRPYFPDDEKPYALRKYSAFIAAMSVAFVAVVWSRARHRRSG